MKIASDSSPSKYSVLKRVVEIKQIDVANRWVDTIIQWQQSNTTRKRHSWWLTELLSQIFRVLSSEAETSRLESEDQETSEMPWNRQQKIRRSRQQRRQRSGPGPGPGHLPVYGPRWIFQTSHRTLPRSLSACLQLKRRRRRRRLSCSQDAFKDWWLWGRRHLTGAGQPLSVGAEFYRRHGFCVSGQRELHRVVWFGRVGLETHHNGSKTRLKGRQRWKMNHQFCWFTAWPSKLKTLMV